MQKKLKLQETSKWTYFSSDTMNDLFKEFDLHLDSKHIKAELLEHCLKRGITLNVHR